MKKYLSFIILSLLVLLVSSCTKEILKGTGKVVTETRLVPAFSSYLADADHSIEIVYSPKYKVELEGYENLLSGYLVKVENGRLFFEYANFKNIENDNIRLRIYTPSLDSLITTDKANVVLTSGFNQNSFTSFMDSSSILHVAAGSTSELNLTAKAGSSFFGELLVAKKAKIAANGNAKLEVRATEKVTMQIAGNAVVHYWGSAPTEEIDIEEQGQLIRH